MTDDEKLIERIRPLLIRRKGFSEKRMFGGVCFFISGNMCAGTWKGALVVRLDKRKHEEVLNERYTKPFAATGKVMKGWALVEAAGIDKEADLKAWLERTVKFARSLPPK
jgi:TfoX/Sxy family transcriptional regulator of competence genes